MNDLLIIAIAGVVLGSWFVGAAIGLVCNFWDRKNETTINIYERMD